MRKKSHLARKTKCRKQPQPMSFEFSSKSTAEEMDNGSVMDAPSIDTFSKGNGMDALSNLTEKLSGTGKEFVVLTSDPRCGDGAKCGSRLGRIFLDYNPDILNKFISFCTEHYIGTDVERTGVPVSKPKNISRLPPSGYSLATSVSSSHSTHPEEDLGTGLRDSFPASDVADINTANVKSEEVWDDDEEVDDICDEDGSDDDKHAWQQSQMVDDSDENEAEDAIADDSKQDEVADFSKTTIKNSPKKNILKETSKLQTQIGRRTLSEVKQNSKKKKNDNISTAFRRRTRPVSKPRSQRLSWKLNIFKEEVVNFECPGCGDSLADQSAFVKHVLSEHTLERKNNKKTENISWNIDSKQCPICGQFTEAGGMNFHVFVHCPDVLKYPCNRCAFVFLKLDKLVEHEKKEHGSIIDQRTNHTMEETSYINVKGEEKLDKTLCDTHFKVRSSYLKHMRSHKGQSPYKCNSCDREYVRKFDLNKHMSTHQGAGPVYRCDMCDKTFKTRSGKNSHRMYAHGDRGLSKYGKDQFDCRYCGGVLGSHHSLVKHEKIHERSTETQLENMGNVCNIVKIEDLRMKEPCSSSVSNTDTGQKTESSVAGDTICISQLSETDNQHVPESSSSQTVDETLKNVDESTCIGSDSAGGDHIDGDEYDNAGQSSRNVDKKLHACRICNMQFPSLRALTGHKNIHSESGKYACDLCGKIFLRTLSLIKHRQLHNKTGTFSCKTCLKQFKSIENLRRHAKNHLEVKPYNCTVCGKGCTEKRYLTTHMLVHSQKKEFICEVCGKAYSNQQRLKEHGYVHTGERPYKCTVCDLTFRSHDVLRRHIPLHSSFRKFMCDTCGKTFRQLSTMITHRNSHSNGPTHICKVCGQGCKSTSALNCHFISFHLKPEDVASYKTTVHVCEVCGKMFGEKQDYDGHMRTHTGEKPFSCTICMKMFSDKSNLRSHIRNHNGDRSKKCDVCGKGFMFNRDLKKHMVSHSERSLGGVVEARTLQQQSHNHLVPTATAAYEMVTATQPLHVAENVSSEVHEEDIRAVAMIQEVSVVHIDPDNLTWHTL